MAIKEGAEQGLWVILQNCQVLEKLIISYHLADKAFKSNVIALTFQLFARDWKETKATWHPLGCLPWR